MSSTSDRRDFLKLSSLALGSAIVGTAGQRSLAQGKNEEPMFKISLAEWSLHKMLKAGELDNLDFPSFTKNNFNIEAVEYVNQFFMDKAEDDKYLHELKMRGDDIGVKHLLIMVDGEGQLGAPDEKQRQKVVENHHKWVDAAKYLGCHSIRVNAQSEGTYEEQRDRAADGLRMLSEFGAERDINVIVENHGGLSSNAKWLVEVIELVNLPNCGTLPDFGNFKIGTKDNGEEDWYDRYEGVQELMPFAKAVSAKSHEFDESGNEVRTDYFRMMAIVLAAGYRGYVGIEWEGGQPNEVEGVRLTQQLLERVRDELA